MVMKINSLEISDKDHTEIEFQKSSELHWIDISRDTAVPENEFPAFLQNVLHERHVKDIQNNMHPPFYENNDEYEMLIFRAVDQRFEIIEPRTRSTVFILLENMVITIRDKDDNTFSKLHTKWLANKAKRPSDLPDLVHGLLDAIGEIYLDLREPLNSQIQDWQQRLLDPNDPFNDWQVLMTAKSSLRSLNINLQLQREVLQSWREDTKYSFSQSQAIHFNDLDGHFGRAERLSDAIRSDIDSLTHIYFTSTGQKTNSIVQFLAVISAIFLPLNLIAGLFGMNFESMPMLKNPWGPVVVVMAMFCVSAILLWWFKRNRWF